jgi:predicted small lipoprotein YifL
MRALIALVLLAVAACGVKGDPVAPSRAAPEAPREDRAYP